MVGKVNLYVPGDASLAVPATVAYNSISQEVKLTGAFKYTDEKEAVRFALKSASSGEVAVIVADNQHFNAVKLLLLKVLSVKVLSSSEITEKIGNTIPADSKDYKIHTAIGEGGKFFPSENGLFSAFTCKCGKGAIVMLPLEKEQLDYALSAGIFGKKEQPAPDPQKPENTEKSKIMNCLNAIAKSGKSVTIANDGLADVIIGIITSSGIAGLKFKKSRTEIKGNPEDKDYIANLAKAAKEKAETDFGTAISDISADGTISVCVADSESAKVEVIHSIPDDDSTSLTKAAAVKVIEMIAEAVTGGINPPKRKIFKNKLTPLIIIIVCLAIAAVACLTVGIVVFRRNMSNKVPGDASPQTITDIPAYQTPTDLDSDEDGEVVPNFADESTTIVADLEASILDLIDTTYQNGGSKTNALNGQYTTNANDILATLATSAAVTSTTVAVSQEPQTNENGETLTNVAEETTTALSTSSNSKINGKFVFTVYGYGHGAGMSQRGAIALARQGKTANQILTHYYQGVTLMVDKNTPKTIVRRGQEMTLVAFLCRTVSKEIGTASPAEAMKAQAIAAYTYAMCNSFDGQQSFDPYFNYKGSAVEQAVFSMLHITSEDQDPHAIYVSYKGSYANTVYFASAAGKTTSAQSVWGSNRYPYLSGGRTSPEQVEISTAEFTVEQMERLIRNYASSHGASVNLDSNPATWLRILAHDGAYSNSIGYVDSISVCGMTMSGNTFRDTFMSRAIKSHCFTIKFIQYT